MDSRPSATVGNQDPGQELTDPSPHYPLHLVRRPHSFQHIHQRLKEQDLRLSSLVAPYVKGVAGGRQPGRAESRHSRRRTVVSRTGCTHKGEE